jgi:hypothetical protein
MPQVSPSLHIRLGCEVSCEPLEYLLGWLVGSTWLVRQHGTHDTSHTFILSHHDSQQSSTLYSPLPTHLDFLPFPMHTVSTITRSTRPLPLLHSVTMRRFHTHASETHLQLPPFTVDNDAIPQDSGARHRTHVPNRRGSDLDQDPQWA